MKDVKEFTKEYILKLSQLLGEIDENVVADIVDLFERVSNIRKRLRILQNTDFYKELCNTKVVRPPIQKTNLLMKNVDYNNCYKLWLFVSAYTNVGYSVDVKDKNLPVDGDYYDDLTFIAGLSLKNMFDRNILDRKRYEDIPFVEREEKQYKLITNYKITPDFDKSREQVGAESINEYYFRRMRDELIRLAAENEIAIERDIQVNFNKFYRTLSRINDELVEDVIEQYAEERVDKLEKSELTKKRKEIVKQMERVRRRTMLTKLKWEELEKAQRREERAKAKLEKLKAAYREERSAYKVRTVKNVRMVVKTGQTPDGEG